MSFTRRLDSIYSFSFISGELIMKQFYEEFALKGGAICVERLKCPRTVVSDRLLGFEERV